MNGTYDCIFLSFKVFLVQVALEHNQRKLVLPNLPFSLNNVVLLLDFGACFLFNLARECAKILFVSQKKELVRIVLFSKDGLLFHFCAEGRTNK